MGVETEAVRFPVLGFATDLKVLDFPPGLFLRVEAEVFLLRVVSFSLASIISR